MKPTFAAGRNMAMKVPAHEYAKTVAFYRDVLGLDQLTEPAKSSTDSVRFAFGDKVLWIDRVPSLSQAELWLEVVTDDPDQAAAYLTQHGCVRRDEVEPLPAGFAGCWISSPCNIIHLVTTPSKD
jgi:catechol 2,3-dioxygenase-like lactoylglutathione lyase family enzyme